jgi:ketosteroid isomerase-like protein
MTSTTAAPSSAVEDAVLAVVTGMTSALHRGDVDAVMASYEQDPAVVFTPGEPATSRSADARLAFEEILGVAPHFSCSGHEVVVAGDLALHLAPWTMTGTAPDGTALEQSGLSVAVLRRQPSGTWRLVIDDPYGDRLLGLD